MKMEQGYDIFTSPLPSSCESSFSVLPEYLERSVILTGIEKRVLLMPESWPKS